MAASINKRHPFTSVEALGLRIRDGDIRTIITLLDMGATPGTTLPYAERKATLSELCLASGKREAWKLLVDRFGSSSDWEGGISWGWAEQEAPNSVLECCLGRQAPQWQAKAVREVAEKHGKHYEKNFFAWIDAALGVQPFSAMYRRDVDTRGLRESQWQKMQWAGVLRRTDSKDMLAPSVFRDASLGNLRRIPGMMGAVFAHFMGIFDLAQENGIRLDAHWSMSSAGEQEGGMEVLSFHTACCLADWPEGLAELSTRGANLSAPFPGRFSAGYPENAELLFGAVNAVEWIQARMDADRTHPAVSKLCSQSLRRLPMEGERKAALLRSMIELGIGMPAAGPRRPRM